MRGVSKGVDYDHNPFYLPSGCRGNNSLLINLTTNFNCHKYMPGVTGSFKRVPWLKTGYKYAFILASVPGNDSNLLIVFYVQIMPDDLVMQLHRF